MAACWLLGSMPNTDTSSHGLVIASFMTAYIYNHPTVTPAEASYAGDVGTALVAAFDLLSMPLAETSSVYLARASLVVAMPYASVSLANAAEYGLVGASLAAASFYRLFLPAMTLTQPSRMGYVCASLMTACAFLPVPTADSSLSG